jgi:chemotaxis protein MotB
LVLAGIILLFNYPLFADWFYYSWEYEALENEKYALELEIKNLQKLSRGDNQLFEKKIALLETEIKRLNTILESERKSREEERSMYSEKFREYEVQQRTLKSELSEENTRQREGLLKEIQVLQKTLEDERKNSLQTREVMKKELSKMEEQRSELENKLSKEIQKGQVKLTQDKDKITIQLDDSITFDSGSSELKKEIQPALDKIIDILEKNTNNKIIIEGHTDNVPVRNADLRDNWHLSSERALSVLKYILDSSKKLSPDKFSAAAYGEFQPIQPNQTKEGRAQNRRVQLVLLPLRK